jgi:hypothetical protein
MKKTYYNSPALPVATFVLFSIAAFVLLILKREFWVNEANYIEVIASVGVLCFVAWGGRFFTISKDIITRRVLFLFAAEHKCSDVEEVREVSDTDIYGTSRFMQIRFKNGDRWNLGMLNKKDVAELLEVIKKHQQA